MYVAGKMAGLLGTPLYLATNLAESRGYVRSIQTIVELIGSSLCCNSN